MERWGERSLAMKSTISTSPSKYVVVDVFAPRDEDKLPQPCEDAFLTNTHARIFRAGSGKIREQQRSASLRASRETHTTQPHQRRRRLQKVQPLSSSQACKKEEGCEKCRSSRMEVWYLACREKSMPFSLKNDTHGHHGVYAYAGKSNYDHRRHRRHRRHRNLPTHYSGTGQRAETTRNEKTKR